MLKLKYLFDNRDLALMLLQNWHYDEASLHLLDHFRISSNAIYPFKDQGRLCFLRFVPDAEKDKASICEELKVISLLSQNNFKVPGMVKSKQGNQIETKATPWGIFHAVVFEGVGTKTLENLELDEKMAHLYGSSLAKLHQISQNVMQSKVQRSSVFDILLKINREAMTDASIPNIVKTQANDLYNAFDKLKAHSLPYGLIHFDYELDNILFDPEAEALYAIDFDDCMYGFFGQDIERAINSIESEVGKDTQELIKASLLQGYAEGGGDLGSYEVYRDLFKAFADLYSYLRIKRALEETWDHEPIWMSTLRDRLSMRMQAYCDRLL